MKSFRLTGKRHPRLRRAGLAFGLAAALLGLYLGFLQISGNFHTVIAGELYRSGQPSPAQLERYVRAHGIRTIVNLRGGGKASWYRDEVATAERLGVTHIDFRMSAARELSQEQAEQIIETLRDAPKPILIHCMGGADRSGLVAALYVAAVGKLGEAAAESQISIRYGHISLPIISAYAMDRTFEKLEPWLGFPDS